MNDLIFDFLPNIQCCGFLDTFGGLIGGAIAGIGSLAGSLFGKKDANKAIQLANQGNMELAQYQNEANIDMWNRQNEYNTPLQQMERLKEAGLNPNLMYGQGNTGNASSAPQMQRPDMQAYTGFGDYGASAAANNLIQGLSGYVNVRKTEAEIDAIRQNTENMKVQGEGFELRNAYQLLLNASKDTENKYLVDMIRSRISNLDSSTVSNYASSKLKGLQKDYTEAQLSRFNQLTPLVVNQVETALKQSLFDLYNLSPAKLNNIIADTRLKELTSRLTDLNATALFNQIEFGEKSVSWNMYKREYDSIMMESEKEIKEVLLRNGINLKGSNWFTPLLYDIEKTVALPITSLLGF